MQTISLENSELVVLVDDDDYTELAKVKWYLSRGNRARAPHIGRTCFAKTPSTMASMAGLSSHRKDIIIQRGTHDERIG